MIGFAGKYRKEILHKQQKNNRILRMLNLIKINLENNSKIIVSKEQERARLQDLTDEELFNATLTEEEKEENRRAQKEEDEVERLLALEAEEEKKIRAATAAALNSNISVSSSLNVHEIENIKV